MKTPADRNTKTMAGGQMIENPRQDTSTPAAGMT